MGLYSDEADLQRKHIHDVPVVLVSFNENTSLAFQKSALLTVSKSKILVDYFLTGRALGLRQSTGSRLAVPLNEGRHVIRKRRTFGR